LKVFEKASSPIPHGADDFEIFFKFYSFTEKYF